MTYVFIFTGEFGYELLNWNGVIRKWCQKNKKEDDTIVICSRNGMELIYEMADYYIDLSEIDSYNNCIADCYWSIIKDENNKIIRHHQYQQDVFSAVQQSIEESGFINIRYIYTPNPDQVDYMDGCTFGTGGIYGPERLPYGRLDVNNNVYKKFTSDLSDQKEIEKAINFSLDQPYILCQSAVGTQQKRDKTILEVDDFIKSISAKIPVICLGFDTGKSEDSKSSFNNLNSANIYHCNASTLREQSCLIEKSKHCVFFTEGDFRSIMYVPPFFGKSITAVASKAIFDPTPTDIVSVEPGKTNAPLDFWNQHVWNFGGKIIPLYYETIQQSNNYDNIIEDIIKN
tara:strand:+ start:2914 stop:3942 length:1029 start_codon:yes stop_codon:yes gene_type:complete